MTETKLVRLDMDAYNILNQLKKQLNAELKKKKQAERVTFSDVVRHLKNMSEISKARA
jgi:predicted CopG family antitoxin